VWLVDLVALSTVLCSAEEPRNLIYLFSFLLGLVTGNMLKAKSLTVTNKAA